MSIELSDDYRPSDDEEFMNERQLAFFRRLLENWKADILDGAKQTIHNLQDESGSLPDVVDRASAESDKALELRTRDRQRKLISKIDSALRRIGDGTYGFCEATGRLACAVWKPAQRRRSASRRKSATSARNAPCATTDHGFPEPEMKNGGLPVFGSAAAFLPSTQRRGDSVSSLVR